LDGPEFLERVANMRLNRETPVRLYKPILVASLVLLLHKGARLSRWRPALDLLPALRRAVPEVAAHGPAEAIRPVPRAPERRHLEACAEVRPQGGARAEPERGRAERPRRHRAQASLGRCASRPCRPSDRPGAARPGVRRPRRPSRTHRLPWARNEACRGEVGRVQRTGADPCRRGARASSRRPSRGSGSRRPEPRRGRCAI
jgi:hypothetical protein